MAITDVPEFAHLTAADIENLGAELDEIRRDIEESLGERDARYIRRTIAAQRALEVAGRLILAASSKRKAWWAGTATLATAKIIENMEIGHNVMHGQWDWMNDPEIHSSSWEWDMAGASKHWRFTHNFMHHKYTNILGMDDDVGYGLLRVTRDERWKPNHVFNVVYNAMLSVLFEWGVALQHLELGKIFKDRDDRQATLVRLGEFTSKAGRQIFKDYVMFPALTSLSPAATYRSTASANAVANIIRNIWSNAVIFCGHFPDGAEKFTKTDMVGESKGQWYLRQMLGSANFENGPALRFMSGNLCHQIEHHLYPDLPSNRLYEVSLRVQQICERYDLPYTTGPFLVQYAKTWRTIAKLSVPDKFLRDTADDAPETRSELMFAGLVVEAEGPSPYGRRGLKSAITAARVARQERRRARKRAAKTPTPVPDAGAPRSGQDGPVAA
ncbi:fatty acid desaturase family protein [Mycolicibacterium fallax]|uniref:Stearoyl-CoA 9-desaturase n=1 Tax=Mycolicibacterium fallax TaxID=1793 RepID=A0A1X1RER4_MYCFA|nr:fatty acid desaturase [Mycolicibacterium fallax]ORV04250.1 stearoyl-CoA 9-desaturase [Mycolicibacterium fallax]BBY98425.1 stearoyl-CoA 9-desaturase [Mycolicibacterium fallax]HSA39218.1 fatty acid desaturase [Mycobacterium sp.]